MADLSRVLATQSSNAHSLEAVRKPLEQVEFDTSESKDGAWGVGKAPLALVTEVRSAPGCTARARARARRA